MSSVSDHQDGSPGEPPDLRSLTVSSPVHKPEDHLGVLANPEAQHAARRTVHLDLNADSSASHRNRAGSTQQSAADTSRDVTGAQRSDLASLIRECGDSAIRSLLVEPDELQPGGKPPADDIREICSKVGGALHAVTRREPGMMVVTFMDARDCGRVKGALARAVGTVVSVRDARPEESEHIVTGLVLAVKQVDKEDDEIVVEDMKSMLSIFGAVAFGQRMRVPNSPQAHVAVFEFFSIRDAAQAVEAIGNRSGSSFSLFLVNRDGSPARLPPPAMPLAVAGSLEEGSQLSSHSARTGSSSVPLVNDDVSDVQRASLPLFSNGSAHVALLAAAHMHAHTSPPPASQAPPPMPPSALSHEWPAPPNMHMMQGMPMQPPGRRPADFLTTFDPNEATAGGVRARTTIMIRNIPCRWTADDLLSVLSHIIDGTWDLLYMPCKNTAVANAGYAFMNFCTSQDTLRLYNSMHGHQWPHTRSGKICEVRYARIQGRQLLTHLNSSDPSGAAAFRGYLAYPSGGTIVIHGPNNAQPALPMHPGMHVPMQHIKGAQQAMDASQYALRGMSPVLAYAPGVPGNVAPRPPPGVQYMPGMVPSGGANTAVADNSMRPQEMEGYSEMVPGSWPMQPSAYCGPVSAEQYAMQMQPVGVALPTTRGMDTSGSNAYQLQCMLQSLMQSMPPPQ